MLSNIPQLSSLFDEADATLQELERFVAGAEAELCICLRESSLPSAALVLAIATCKVRAVETSIALTFRLKQEVGSFALMSDAGFRHLDFLQCCKFAEGITCLRSTPDPDRVSAIFTRFLGRSMAQIACLSFSFLQQHHPRGLPHTHAEDGAGSTEAVWTRRDC